jgi:hypothetical protein
MLVIVPTSGADESRLVYKEEVTLMRCTIMLLTMTALVAAMK